jgi:TolB protein
MNADGGGPHAITADGGGQPVWSPTGDKIAYTASAGSLEIFIVNADGTDRKQLTNNANNDALPAWSPDGRFIFFRTDRDGKWSIYVMNADGSNQRWVIDAHVSPDRWQWEKISTTK